MMSKVMFCYPNHADRAAAVLSGGSWEATLPLTNLQEEPLAQVARSTDAVITSTIVNVDFGAQQYIYVFALPKHNLTIDALVRVRLGNDNTFAADNYDTGWVKAYPVIYPANMPLWDDPGVWDGYLAQTDYDAGMEFGWTHVLTAPTGGRYVRVEINDTANPDGYVELGRLVLASGYQPIINFVPGAALGYENATTSTRTDGGAVFYKASRQWRRFNCLLKYQTEDEAMVHFYEIQRMLGTSNQLFFVYNISDTTHLARRSFLATVEKLSALEIHWGSYMDQPISLVEAL